MIYNTTLGGVDTPALCLNWCGGVKFSVLGDVLGDMPWSDFVGVLDKSL